MPLRDLFQVGNCRVKPLSIKLKCLFMIGENNHVEMVSMSSYIKLKIGKRKAAIAPRGLQHFRIIE